jgi:thiol-disulfide isomerase/thioredoxin
MPPPFPEVPYASYDWKVRTLAGEPFSMEEVRREVLFLNFWSTACPPCLSELPSKHSILGEPDVVVAEDVLDLPGDRAAEAAALPHRDASRPGVREPVG